MLNRTAHILSHPNTNTAALSEAVLPCITGKLIEITIIRYAVDLISRLGYMIIHSSSGQRKERAQLLLHLKTDGRDHDVDVVCLIKGYKMEVARLSELTLVGSAANFSLPGSQQEFENKCDGMNRTCNEQIRRSYVIPCLAHCAAAFNRTFT